VEDCLLIVKTEREGRRVLETLLQRRDLQDVLMLAVVSDDVDIHDRENSIWGIFTRFDCERDVIFSEQRLIGISPIYNGILGIDATWKKGYPKPLVMEAKVRRFVESRWDQYWQ
jgi:4-hydroxy-3-polyprenylbenzoate decarboxylase